MRKIGLKWAPLAAMALAVVVPACAPDTEDEMDSDDMAEVREDAAERAEARTESDQWAETDRAYDAGVTSQEVDLLTVRESPEIGEYVATGDGAPVYVFTADGENAASACTGECARAWPPVTGDVEVTGELDAELLGTITRPDGTEQVTFDGQPLYLFARDTGGSRPAGQDVKGFGGEWYVVGPDGKPVEDTGSRSGESERQPSQPSG